MAFPPSSPPISSLPHCPSNFMPFSLLIKQIGKWNRHKKTKQSKQKSTKKEHRNANMCVHTCMCACACAHMLTKNPKKTQNGNDNIQEKTSKFLKIAQTKQYSQKNPLNTFEFILCYLMLGMEPAIKCGETPLEKLIFLLWVVVHWSWLFGWGWKLLSTCPSHCPCLVRICVDPINAAKVCYVCQTCCAWKTLFLLCHLSPMAIVCLLFYRML